MDFNRNIFFSFCLVLFSAFHIFPDTPVIPNPKDAINLTQLKHQPKDMLDDAIIANPRENSSQGMAKKPPRLPFLELPHNAISTELDTLMTKQIGHIQPYIPFIQTVTVGIEQISLFKNIWYLFKNLNQPSIYTRYEFSGDVSILFRGNIRLAGNIGYSSYYEDKMAYNQYAYTCKGWYGGIGIGYLIHFNATNDIYMGINYNRSHFINTALNKGNQAIAAPQKNLTASWSDIVLGVESRFFDKVPLYGGCTLHIGWLYHYTKFEAAQHYCIPGYGSNLNRSFNLGLGLHLLYKFIFLEKSIPLS